jgi:SRSO17 transposase
MKPASPNEGKAQQECKSSLVGQRLGWKTERLAVFLNDVTEQGHGLIDRELYLPQEWVSDAQRSRQASIPETVPFRTKCELAQLMLERATDAQVPIRWVVSDTV